MLGKRRSRMTSRDMFMRLFRYISGANKEKVKIEMTVPVATKYDAMGNKTKFRMLFFAPKKYQTSTPMPTNPQVAILKLPKICVYVR